MIEYLKYITAVKVIYDNQELIIGCTIIGCKITSAIINKVCKYASGCRCFICEEEQKAGNNPEEH